MAAPGQRLAQVENLTNQAATVDTLPLFDPTHPDVNVTTLWGYDVQGRVVTTTAAAGSAQARTSWTCYDALGRTVKTVQNPTVADPCADYTPSGRPDQDLIQRTVYGADGRQIATIAPDGKISRTYYDGLGRAITVTQNLVGQAVTLATPPTYDPAHSDQNAPASGATTYDAAGRVVSQIDLSGLETHYCYDAVGRTVKTVQNQTVADPCADYTPSSQPDQDLINRTVYDKNGNAVAAIDPAGRVTRTYYDALNRPVVTIQNLTSWDITRQTWPAFDPAHPDQNIGSQTFYDGQGRAYRTLDLTRTGDPAGRPYTGNWTCYDDAGRTTWTVTNASVDNPCAPGFAHTGNSDENLVTSYVYDDLGRQIAAVAPDGKISRMYYTASGERLAQADNLTGQEVTVGTVPVFDPAHPDQNTVTLWGYDASGNVVTTTAAAGSAQARTSWMCYDALGRTVKTVQNPTVVNPCVDYAPSGQPDQDLIQRTVYGADGRQIATIAPDGKISRTYYDGLGRAITVTQNLVGQAVTLATPPPYDPSHPDQNAPASGATTYDIAGRVTRTTDVTGLATEYGYDALGRTATVTILPANGAPIVSRSLYDKLGNVTDRIDPKGIVTHYEYDALNRLTAVVENYRPGYLASADTNVRTEYGYDAHGNRLTLLDGNQHTTTFSYDALDRLVTETDPLTHTTTYAYDLAGLQVTKTDPNGVTTTYAYDGGHRLAGQTSPQHDADTTFVYDALGNRVAMTDTLGATRWQYDLAGRATQISDPFGQVVSYTYGLAGNRTGLVYPDGKAVAYAFDGLNRMQTAAPQAGWNISGNAAYQYDALGQVITATLPNGITTVYGYDSAHRLTTITHRAADGTLLASYAYTLDAAGNRTGVAETVQQPATAPSGPGTVTVSVRDTSGAAEIGLPVYVFSGTVYLGNSQTTNTSGQATFTLDPGGYRFRSDLNGTQFWSDGGAGANNCVVPDCTSAVVTTTIPLTVTVLDTSGAAGAGLPVYAFNDATYTGYNQTTDANGPAGFTLPQGNYRFRSDKNGTQFWSGTTNQCAVPVCTGTVMTTALPRSRAI